MRPGRYLSLFFLRSFCSGPAGAFSNKRKQKAARSNGSRDPFESVVRLYFAGRPISTLCNIGRLKTAKGWRPTAVAKQKTSPFDPFGRGVSELGAEYRQEKINLILWLQGPGAADKRGVFFENRKCPVAGSRPVEVTLFEVVFQGPGY